MIIVELNSLAPAKKNRNEITEDDLAYGYGHKLPNKIDIVATKGLKHDLPEKVLEAFNLLEAQGWTFYAVRQSRGYCTYQTRVITIPVFALTRGDEYKTYYIAHEIAHAFAGYKNKHNSIFMRELQEICPEECIHHELGYKPRNARAAGITEYISDNDL